MHEVPKTRANGVIPEGEGAGEKLARLDGGEGGIRTRGTAGPYNGFRGRRLQPLGHLSAVGLDDNKGGGNGSNGMREYASRRVQQKK